jgi:integrase
MSTRTKNQHLLCRKGTWYFNKRVEGRNAPYRKSLRTKNIEEARDKRDKLLAKFDLVKERVTDHKDLIAVRKQYLSSFKEDEREILEDQIIDKSEEIAHELGVWEVIRSDTPEPDLTDKEREPLEYWKAATGRLTPIKKFRDVWLKTFEHKRTKLDYKRAIDLLASEFAAVEELDWDKARAYLRYIKEKESVSTATVRKWISAYINFWEFFDRDGSIWRGHKLKTDKTAPKRPWTPPEVIQLYQYAVSTDHWLQHPIWIAAHTGARLGAICALEYRPDEQAIFFPAKKRELNGRLIPAHPDIVPNLEYWIANKRSVSSVGGQFTTLKQVLGFSNETDFHSFRRTFTTELENLGCPESITADIVGHKKQTITYGLYSGGTRLEVMRRWIEQISYAIDV